MKLLSITGFTLLLAGLSALPGIYDFTVPKIDGDLQPLSVYGGKKMLIVTLPVQQTATADSFLYSLDTLANAHTSDLQVIAVPSYEDGYTPSQKNQLAQWYHSKLGTGIVITEGLYTRKTSGTQQHPLFKWLTDATQNSHFSMDVTGSGFKFFVKGDGALYGVLESPIKIGSKAVNKVLGL